MEGPIKVNINGKKGLTINEKPVFTADHNVKSISIALHHVWQVSAIRPAQLWPMTDAARSLASAPFLKVARKRMPEDWARSACRVPRESRQNWAMQRSNRFDWAGEVTRARSNIVIMNLTLMGRLKGSLLKDYSVFVFIWNYLHV